MNYCLKILVVIIVLNCNNKSIAQDSTIFALINATWYYNQYSLPPANKLLTFVSERDTSIDGYNAKIIGCYIYQNQELIRVDSLTKYTSTICNKVYYKVNSEFVELFDFGADIGDTIHSAGEMFPILMGCDADFTNDTVQFSYIIDSISSIIIDGTTLRMQYVHVSSSSTGLGPNWYFNSPIIERMGQIGYGSFWWGGGADCITGVGYLRCYIDSDISFRNHEFIGNYDCDFTEIPEI